VDDDTLPVIDLTYEELAEDDYLRGPDQALAPPSPRPRRWRGHGGTTGRRLGLVAAMVAIAMVGTAGGLAWSGADRRVPADLTPRAGEFADWLRCDGRDPYVRNDLDLWDDAAPPRGRQLPMPAWLRDRSLSATRIRTAADAARWSNTNSDAALAFGTVTLQEWDAATRFQLERAERWVRAWWSRQRDGVPPTWTEGAVLAAVREAVFDDRRLTEQAARTERGSFSWRVLPLPPGRERADTAVIGATARGGSGLVEVLVYRRSADGYLRLRGRAYCYEADDVRPDYLVARNAAAESLEPPALACTRPLPLHPQPLYDTHVDGPVVVATETLPIVEPPPLLPLGPPPAPDGHTLPRELLPHETTWPALSPDVALERLKASEHRPRDTVGGNLAFALLTTGSTKAYAAGTYKGQVKLVIELRRQLGGGWEVVNHSGCAADLLEPA